MLKPWSWKAVQIITGIELPRKPSCKHYGQENIEPDHQIAAESKHRSYCDADG